MGTSTLSLRHSDFETVHIVADNPEIDINDVPSDIWPLGGIYPFPEASATTTILSNSNEDKAGNAGAHTVRVSGLVDGFIEASTVATMDGTTPVTLEYNFLRINTVEVLTVGPAEVNQGNIDVNHSSTVLARVLEGTGKSSQSAFSIASTYLYATVQDLRVRIASTQNARVKFWLLTRTDGFGWIRRDFDSISRDTGFASNIPTGIDIPPTTDVILRVIETTRNNTEVVGELELSLWNKETILTSA